ncbi:glucokinase [Lottiidibacillus patelloidae]|uniref:Glucokinase n=1 Tax=Lottiidibacillus patelloidae TaxID=2670334 RepID=A0A263BT45_9BACI|nr:ROK family glucokinase [Lottiidibacillus patelloidae]OZM56346.1 glucokinase [Lottiidibacillus patelloidae]
MSNQYIIGVDLGGTSIKMAIVNGQGEIKFQTSEPTKIEAGATGIFHQINNMIDFCCKNLKIERFNLIGMGIGAPAFLDIKKGFVKEAVNLQWKNIPLKEQLENITKLPVFIDNDANVAALGEMWRGAGEGSTDLLCITLGTGVGSGVIINGQIYHGAHDTSGEFGHTTVIAEGGSPCNCGKTGCLETVSSATGLIRLVTEAINEGHPSSLAHILASRGRLTAKYIAEAAYEGDELAIKMINKASFYLGLALGNYAVALNPSKIVVGGGLSHAGSILFEPIREYYKKFALPHLTGNIDIVPAKLGNDAGVIGAAWLVVNNK